MIGNFIAVARFYKGTPYHFKGRSKGGLDCAGHYIKSINKSGIYPDYEYLNYNTNPNPKGIIRALQETCDIVDTIAPGCVLLINYSGLPQHIAIYTEDDTLVHVYSGAGKVVEEKFTKYWKDRVYTIFKVRIP